jgi:hypothetical protein
MYQSLSKGHEGSCRPSRKSARIVGANHGHNPESDAHYSLAPSGEDPVLAVCVGMVFEVWPAVVRRGLSVG